MSTNIMRDASDRVKNSGLVIPVTLVFALMFLVACALMYEDYSTSLLGYEALPTHKANEWVIPLVALLPQLGQVGFAYVFVTDTNKKWAAAIMIVLWNIDVLTDVYYKAYGLNWFWTGAATIETITIYSIGSEIMLATSIAMLVGLLPAFFKQLDTYGKYVLGVDKPAPKKRAVRK